jgi:membrane fusion protein, multidrug efflux system
MDRQVPEPHAGASDNTHRKISRRRSVIGSLIAVAVLAAIGWLAWHLTHQGNTPPQGGPGGRRGAATTVGVATAGRVDIPVILDALGTVNASTVTVHAQVSGVLQKLLFTEGQMMKAGQVLAMIDPRQFDMALMQARGQRQRDEAQLDNARITLQRFKTLLEQDSIARQDVDTQAALVKQLEGAVTTDRALEGTARLNLGYSKVVAPISGRIGLQTVNVGNLVGPNDAAGVAVITRVSPIDVEFAIPQDRVPELRERLGPGAELQVTALDRTRANTLDTGKFLALDNQVDTQTGTVRAKARFANEKLTLFPSQFVNVRLLMRTIKDAVVVPVTALRHGSNGDFVYVLNKEKRTVALRPVTRGEATVDQVQIASGLAAGEQVITEGADRLKDGAQVMLPGDKPAFGGNGKRAGGHRRSEGAGVAASSSPPPSSTGDAASVPNGQRRRRAEAAPQ